MFKLFKRKSKKEQLQSKYEQLLEVAFKLSRTNRTASDAKMAEAEEIRKQIDALG